MQEIREEEREETRRKERDFLFDLGVPYICISIGTLLGLFLPQDCPDIAAMYAGSIMGGSSGLCLSGLRYRKRAYSNSKD